MIKEKEFIKHTVPDVDWPTAEVAAASRWFSPIKIGKNLVAKSRTWVPAMVPWRATEDGFVTQEVLDWYATRYGDEVLQEPPRRGVGLFAWILPVIVLIAGGVWLVYIIRKWSSGRTAAVPIESKSKPSRRQEPSDEYMKRVEQDLENM